VRDVWSLEGSQNTIGAGVWSRLCPIPSFCDSLGLVDAISALFFSCERVSFFVVCSEEGFHLETSFTAVISIFRNFFGAASVFKGTKGRNGRKRFYFDEWKATVMRE